MTETLLQKIEDKVLLLLAEITNLRQQVTQYKQENTALKAEQGNYKGKLEELLSVLEILEQEKTPETGNQENIAIAV